VNAKECLHCGEVFVRPERNRRISDDVWANRRYCSPRCGRRAFGVVHESPKDYGADVEQSVTVASAALRDRSLALFDRIAKQRKLKDRFDAAAACGMAA
jgi:hypothetical protein